MNKPLKSQRLRFGEFKAGTCPYCGSDHATLTKVKKGYVGNCISPKCRAENKFTSTSCMEW